MKTYGLTAVATAAGVGETTLRGWFDRGLLPIGSGGRDADGRSNPRAIPFETALQAAIAASLIKLGFTAGRACRLALSFSDSGNERRLPGQLFTDDLTVLMATPEREAAHIVPASFVSEALIDEGSTLSSSAFVNVNEIYRNVAGRLHHPITPQAMI
ncbi:hypothetical protein [Brucella sp. LJL56]